MEQSFAGERRLGPRGPTNRRLAVDDAGATLGPEYVLVRKTAEGYRCIGRDEAAIIQKSLFGDPNDDPEWLLRQCMSIAKSLNEGDVALAQIYGLRIPLDDLDDGQLSRLARAARFIKAGFNPGQPRVPAGSPEGGQWTDEGDSSAVLIPAQGALIRPAPLPWEILYVTPKAPTEIVPPAMDLPGAERSIDRPVNPFPRDPECAAEWAHAYQVCDEAEREGKFKVRAGWSGQGLPQLRVGVGFGTMRRQPPRPFPQSRQEVMVQMTQDSIIDDEMREHMRLLRSDPMRLLELREEQVRQFPESGGAYFARHQAWHRLGNHVAAMADLDKSLDLEPHYVTYRARANLFRELRRYREAIVDFNKSQELDPEAWVNGFNQVFRADCYAHLGDEPAVIADCADIPDDYWTPGPFDTPPGGKAEVTEALCRLARETRRVRTGDR